MTTNATRRARQHKIIAEHEKTIAALRADNAKKDAALREAHAHLSRKPPNNGGWNALLNRIEAALVQEAPDHG